MPPGTYRSNVYRFFQGVRNATISAWGVTVGYTQLGPFPAAANFGGFSRSARIQTARAGDSSVTLLNPALANRFTVGQWICITGLGLQVFGYPPNFQYNEYKRVTNIVGSVINFDDPFTGSPGLTHTYLHTWPQIDSFPVTFTATNPTTVTWPNHGFSGSGSKSAMLFFGSSSWGGIAGRDCAGSNILPNEVRNHERHVPAVREHPSAAVARDHPRHSCSGP